MDILSISNYLTREIALLVREYITPSLWIRNKTLSLYSVKDDGADFYASDEKRVSVASGLWSATWSPYSGRDLGFIYRSLILSRVDFDLGTLPAVMNMNIEHKLTPFRCNTVLIIGSGKDNHVIDLKLPAEDQTRLGVQEAIVSDEIRGGYNEDNLVALVIPIAYRYSVGRRISDALHTLHQDEKYVKCEIAKIVKGASVKMGEYVSFPVCDSKLYLTTTPHFDFNRILINVNGGVQLKKGSKRIAFGEVNPVSCTPLLKRIFKIITMTCYKMITSRYLSQELQQVIDVIAHDPHFSDNKSVHFRNDLSYHLRDTAPSSIHRTVPLQMYSDADILRAIYEALNLTRTQFF